MNDVQAYGETITLCLLKINKNTIKHCPTTEYEAYHFYLVYISRHMKCDQTIIMEKLCLPWIRLLHAMTMDNELQHTVMHIDVLYFVSYTKSQQT